MTSFEAGDGLSPSMSSQKDELKALECREKVPKDSSLVENVQPLGSGP